MNSAFNVQDLENEFKKRTNLEFTVVLKDDNTIISIFADSYGKEENWNFNFNPEQDQYRITEATLSNWIKKNGVKKYRKAA